MLMIVVEDAAIESVPVRLSFQPSSAAQLPVLRRMVLCFLLIPGQALAGNFYAGIFPATVPWTNGIVPYAFTNNLTAAETNTYLAACANGSWPRT